jgi:hypothetical protein
VVHPPDAICENVPEAATVALADSMRSVGLTVVADTATVSA